jgi:hypothetical protein
MNKEFIPYEEALALKELGFDKGSFAWYFEHNKEFGITNKIIKCDGKDISAPLYQQAFRWFRENFNMHFDIVKCGGGHNNYKIERNAKVSYNTYQEAQDECLRKLIEIVKEKL